MVNRRAFKRLEGKDTKGAVIYWMQREQRVSDNWALIFACERAKVLDTHVVVAFCLADGFTNANNEHYIFMLEGLKEVSETLMGLNIPFYLLYGQPEKEIPAFITQYGASTLVTDFFPLKMPMAWKDKVSSSINIPFYEVDAHNIVPCRAASVKKEYSAATFRPKIKRVLNEYLTEFPDIKPQNPVTTLVNGISFEHAHKVFGRDRRLMMKSGEKEAPRVLAEFIGNRLNGYSSGRNDPNNDSQSGLSPYLHFGQLSPQRAALDVMGSYAPDEDKSAFLEELIVRRELADNFCFYNENYDNLNGADRWALASIAEHREDKRDYIYSYEQLRDADTHEPLWNAAQNEMVYTGKMHGYMRMYWAKKILEWTEDAETALKYAIQLNDTYSMDGRDPNGYVGVMWSIAGVHDSAWQNRPVFGKIRYMNYNGCRSKFDVNAYISKIQSIISENS